MNVRLATLEDVSKIKEIADLLRLDVAEFVWNEPHFIEKQIQKGEYFMVEHNGVPAGIMSLRERKNGLHIETLVIKKEFQSRGLGTECIDFAKHLAKERGIKKMFAYSFSEYNIGNFYQKCGFELKDYVGFYNQRQYNCFEMTVRDS